MDTSYTLSTNYPPKFVTEKFDAMRVAAASTTTTTTTKPEEEEDPLEKLIASTTLSATPVAPPSKEEVEWLTSYVDKSAHPRRTLTELISVAKRSHNWDLMFKLLEGSNFGYFLKISNSEFSGFSELFWSLILR